MPKQNLNPEILAAALEGLEAQRARLDTHIAQTRRLLGTHSQEPAAAAETPRPKRKMSAAARKRISDATRKRWAEYRRKKAEAQAAPKKPAAKAPRKAAKATAKKIAAKGPKTAVAQAATAEGAPE